MTKKKLIDFSSLSEEELDQLSQKWERDARAFEFTLSTKKSPDTKSFDVANKLWKRLYYLERFRVKSRTQNANASG